MFTEKLCRKQRGLPSAPHLPPAPCYEHGGRGHWLPLMSQCWHITVDSSPRSTFGSSMMAHVSLHGLTKNPPCPTCPSLTPNPWWPGASSCPGVLPFPKCPGAGLTQCVVFLDWLLSLCNMQLRCFRVFLWQLLPFQHWIVLCRVDGPRFIHPSSDEGHLGLTCLCPPTQCQLLACRCGRLSFWLHKMRWDGYFPQEALRLQTFQVLDLQREEEPGRAPNTLSPQWAWPWRWAYMPWGWLAQPRACLVPTQGRWLLRVSDEFGSVTFWLILFLKQIWRCFLLLRSSLFRFFLQSLPVQRFIFSLLIVQFLKNSKYLYVSDSISL